MKNIICLVMIMLGMISSVYAGECQTGNCKLRSRVVTVSREVISVPVNITRRSVETTRNFGRKTLTRVRDSVR